VLGGGRTRSLESSFGRRERLWWPEGRHPVGGSRDFGGCEGTLILLALRSAVQGGLGIRLLRFGAVRGEVPRDEGSGVRVFPLSERVRLP